MTMLLADKCIIVTGAARGMRRADEREVGDGCVNSGQLGSAMVERQICWWTL